MNIVDILSDHARNRPDHPAIKDGVRIVTYGALDGLVDDAAANLQAAGIKPGDIVAIALEDSADHLIILCALARVGAVIFSQNPFASDAGLEKSFASMAVAAVIMPDRRWSEEGLTWLQATDICRPSPKPFDGRGVGDDAAMLVIQSSGTTGVPKSILRTQAEFGLWVQRHAQGHGWTAEERCLSLTRMSFSVGRHTSLGMFWLGATVVINHSRSHEELVALVRTKGITYMYLTPSHLVPLLDYAADKAPLFPDLRALSFSSAPITHAQRLLARERLTANCLEAYGTNESSLTTVASPADQDAYPDAVGRIIGGIEVQIVDDQERPLPVGEVGVVRYRGPGYASHYIDNPEATAKAFRGGWFYPGDLGSLNGEGYLFFKGRADDVINNAGAKFYPIEVETVLMAHPQVGAAAAFGWPHSKLGEVAVACVTVTSEIAAKDLQSFCKQKIAGYKVPAIIEIMPELPRNAMGKILKTELRDVIERSVTEGKAKR